MIDRIRQKSYADALDKIIGKILSRKVTLDEKHILIVPDVFTFALEKRLFTACKGAFDLEITTFTRLYSRLVEGDTALSKQGAIMLLKNICRRNADKLSCYSRSALKTGFAVKLYETLTSLRANLVSPDDIERTGLRKSSDIALLYREYLTATEGRFVDGTGRNTLLSAELESGQYLNNAHVYIALYDIFTADISNLIKVIEKKALSLTVATSDEMPSSLKVKAPCEVLCCPDGATEYKHIAKKIKEFVCSGGKYGDVRVVLEAQSIAPVKRIFDEYAIPYYTGERISLIDSELARFVMQVSDASIKKYRTDDMLALSTSYYTGEKKSDIDAFRTFVNFKSVDYNGFLSEFTQSDKIPAEITEGAERVRKSLVSLIAILDGAFTSAEKYASALLKLLDKVSAQEKTQELEALDGRNLSQIYDKTVDIITLLADICKGETLGGDDLVDTLREGFAGSEISLVPNGVDTVQIGTLTQFRGERAKFAVIADFNEGVLPSQIVCDGLLSDDELREMENYDLEVEPKTERKNLLCRGELWHFLQASERLFITYIASDEKKISYDLKNLCSKNGVEILSTSDIEVKLADETDEKKIAFMLGNETGAMESVLLDRSLPFVSSVLEAVSEQNREYFYGKEEKETPIDNSIFMKGKTTSVSALQTYFSCPYKYFLSYGLRLSKKEEGKVSVLDIGSLLHKIAEDFIKAKMPENIKEFVSVTLKNELDKFEKYSYKQNEKVLIRVIEEAEVLCRVIKKQIDAGVFVPLGTEMSFGKDDSVLKTVVLPSGIRLNGSIDRVDTFGKHARVIDYKTGSTNFSYSDLYYGKKIQLAIYMKVLIENGYRPSGLFYLPLSSSWADNEFSNRLDGPFDASEDIILAHDRRALDGGKSTVIPVSSKIKADGSVSLYNNMYLRTEEELSVVCDYAEKVASQAVAEIFSGSVAPSPAKSGQGVSCDYCDFRSACFGKAKTRNSESENFDSVYEAIIGEKPAKKEKE